MELVDFKTTFDGILQKYVEKKIAQSTDTIADKRFKKMVEYIQPFIFSGGKRIRPYCARAVYTGLGGKEEKSMLYFSMFFELFHSFALVHDDIMDQSEKRHNELSTHKYIETLIEGNPNAKHTAESQAILIGDLLLARAYELLYQEHPFPAEFLEAARNNIKEMVEEVITGQMIDVDLSVSPPAELEVISKKNMYKTASYTFIRPMMTGAILAGADAETKELTRQLAENLGLAFQLRDDLFDLTGGDKTKSLFADIQEGQQTHFTYYIFNKGTDEQKALLKECLGKKLTEAEVTKLKKMFEDSGAIAWGKETIAEYISKARKIFSQVEIVDLDVKHGFDSMIKRLERTS